MNSGTPEDLRSRLLQLATDIEAMQRALLEQQPPEEIARDLHGDTPQPVVSESLLLD